MWRFLRTISINCVLPRCLAHGVFRQPSWVSVPDITGKAEYFDSVTAAVDFAGKYAATDDRIVITGSFLSVAEALASRV